MSYWRGFKEGSWMKEINVRDFMNQNYTEYLGTSSFLTGSTESSLVLNKRIFDLLEEEKQKGGVIELDTDVVASIISHNAGYINKSLEKIVGLQTDKPFKRAFHPYGGIQVATKAAEAYGYHISDNLKHVFTEYRKTHNQGVFDVYNGDIRKARRSAIITGLPDGYGRGRIIGDYRRVPLYGVDALIEQKNKDKDYLSTQHMDDENIRLHEELFRQIDFLKKLKEMAELYGFDISLPAASA